MQVSLDILLVCGLFGLLFALSLYFGKAKAISGMLALYIGVLVFSLFPYTALVFSKFQNETARTFFPFLVFVLIWAIAFVALEGAIGRSFHGGFLGKGFEAGILSFASLGFLLSILYNALSFDRFYNFSSPIDTLILSSQALFWWSLIGLGALFFSLRR